MTNPALQELLNSRRDLWRGGQMPADTTSLPVGHAELAGVLPGWPRGALTELLYPGEGIGELTLLLPALARLAEEGRWIAWIAPPYIPYAPALAAHGLDPAKVLLIHPRGENDALWATEQALRSGTCGAVLAWPRRCDDHGLRRLQLAAEEGGSWGVLFRREEGEAARPSPAALRLRLRPAASNRLDVEVLKQRGARPAHTAQMELGDF